jgi:glycosyltransferase involved in cell wall biosynthesis
MELEVIEPEKKTRKFEDEPTISFVVPVHAKNLDKNILKRCLMSLDDQDYEKMEVVIVLNGGEDDELENVAQFFVNKDARFKLIKTAEGGACNARNVGFDHSTGDIVSFFNSDYRAKPATARLWVDALVKNPDCGFAYGGYEFATTPAMVYGSRPFNSFVLTQFNYIDCGFPLWRKYVVKWDPEVKSLQDWDFWIRVVKTHNLKGFYLGRDFTFIAEAPRPGGLSYDSSSNWNDRVKFVREKNGIATSDLLVTSIGAEFHGIEIAKMLKADFRDMSVIQKPNVYKALYMIGFYMRPDQGHNDHPVVLGSFAEEVKKIIHFVGADIYWLRKFPIESMRILAGTLKMGAHHILCENENAQKELKEFGIDAEIVPIPPYNDYELRPLPETFRVALYLTDRSDFDKYLQRHTLSIVRSMPDVQFSGYGDGAKDFSSPNFKHYGNMDNAQWKQFVYDHSCILRLVRHDTLPMAPCDFILAGRPAISNIPMEYSLLIDTKGKTPITDWDMFAPGFNVYEWPSTKKKIVQAIRSRKKFNYAMPVRDGINVFDNRSQQQRARDHWLKVLDRNKYIETISRMAGLGGGLHA